MAGGFVLSTQLGITISELKSFKTKIQAGINPIMVKLDFDPTQLIKLRAKIESGLGKPIPVSFKVATGTVNDIREKFKTATATATSPIKLSFTSTASSIGAIKKKLKDGFASSATGISIKLEATQASIAALVKKMKADIDIGFFSKPVEIDVSASKTSLNTMRQQIISYFFNRPVPITVTTGPINTRQATARQPQTNRASVSQQRFNPANNVQAVGAKIGKSIEHYGTFTTAVGTFVALFRAMQGAVDEAIKFDREMVRVSQVTGVSVTGLKDLSNEIGKVSREFGVSSTEILKSSVTLAQAGLSAQDTKTALAAIAKTGVSATFEDINDTTEASIALFQQFGIKAGELESVLSSINKVSGAYAIESSDITIAVRRAGGAFKAAGGNLNEFIALLTSVRQTTRESAETIATGFKTIFARLQRSSTQNFIKSLGIDLLNDKGLFVGPFEAIQKIGGALKDIESTDPRFAKIVEELGGFRQVSKVIPLLQQTAIQQRALSIAMRGGNSLAEDAVGANQALSVQLGKLKETFLDTVRAFGDNEWIKSTIYLSIELTKSITSLTKSFTPLIPLITTLLALKIGKNLPDIGKGLVGHFGIGSGGIGGVAAAGVAGAAIGSRASGGGGLGKVGKIGALAAIGLPTFLEFGIKKLGIEIDALGTTVSGVTSGLAGAAVQLFLFSSLMKNIKLGELGSVGRGIDNSRYGRSGSILRRYNATVGEQEGSVRASFARDRDIAAAHYMGGPRTTTRNVLNSQRIQELIDTRDTNLAIVRGRAALNAQRRFDRIQKGALAGGVIATAAGIGLGEYNNQQIEAGKGSSLLGGGAGAAVGGGSGALLAASLSLGPLGIGIAATTLAVAGFGSGLIEASNKIKNYEFNKDFESLSDKLKKVFDGKLSPTSQASSISDTIRKSSSALSGLSAIDAKDQLTKFKNDQPQIERFFLAVAQESRTFDEFQAKTKGILSTFSSLASLPYGELEKSIKDAIDAQNKLNKKLIESSEAVADELQQRVRLIGLESAFNAAFASGPDLDSRLDKIFSTTQGRTSSLGGVSSQSVFNQAGAGKFADPEFVNKLATSIGSSFGGKANGLVSEFSTVTKLSQDLPSILVKLRSQNALGDDGNFQKKFEAELVGIPDSIKKTLIQSLDTAIGGEGDIGALLEKISGDLEGTTAEILKPIKHLFNTFGEFGSKLEEQTKSIIDSYATFDKVLQDIVDTQQKGRDAARDYNDFLLDINGKALSGLGAGLALGSRRKDDLQANFGGNRTKDFASLLSDEKRKDKLKELLASRDANKTNPLLVEGTIQPQISELERATRAASDGLRTIAEDTDGYITALQQLIIQTRQETQVRADYAKTLVSGSKEEQKGLSENIFNAALAAKNGLDSIPQNKRSGVINFFESQGNLSVFGKLGKEHARDLQIDSLTRQFNRIRPGQEEQNRLKATEIVNNKPKSVEDLLKELALARTEQKDAFNAIKSGLDGGATSVQDAIKKSTNDIVGVLNKILARDLAIKGENERITVTSSRDANLDKLRATVKLGDLIGRKNLGTGDINEARTLADKLRQRQEIDKSGIKIAIAKSKFGFEESDFTPGETTTGLLNRTQTKVAENIPGFTFSQDLFNKSRSNTYSRKRLGEAVFDENGDISTIADDFSKLLIAEIETARKKASTDNQELKRQSNISIKSDKLQGIPVSQLKQLQDLLKVIGDNAQSEKSLRESIDSLTREIEKLPSATPQRRILPNESREEASINRGSRGLSAISGQVFASVPPEIPQKLNYSLLRGYTSATVPTDERPKRTFESIVQENPRPGLTPENATIAEMRRFGVSRDGKALLNARKSIAFGSGGNFDPLTFNEREERRATDVGGVSGFLARNVFGFVDQGKQDYTHIRKPYHIENREDVAFREAKKLSFEKDKQRRILEAEKSGRLKGLEISGPKSAIVDEKVAAANSELAIIERTREDNEKRKIRRLGTNEHQILEIRQRGRDRVRANSEGVQSRLDAINAIYPKQPEYSPRITNSLTKDEIREKARLDAIEKDFPGWIPGKSLPAAPIKDEEANRSRQRFQGFASVPPEPLSSIKAPVTTTTSGKTVTQTAAGPVSLQAQDFSDLISAFDKFNLNSNKLADAMNKLNGSKIEITGSHKVEVIINGASVLKEIMPGIREIVATESGKAIKQYAGFLTEKAGLPPYNPPEEKGGK